MRNIILISFFLINSFNLVFCQQNDRYLLQNQVKKSEININLENKKFYISNSDYISYSEFGEGKKNLIFLHGFASSKNSWDDIKEKFDPKEFKLFLIDLKGFGNSSTPKDNKYSILDQTKIISNFINKKINGDYYIIGHSYGGGITLLSPPLLTVSPKGLILIDCAAYSSNIPFFIKYLTNPITNKFLYCIPSKVRVKLSLKKILHKDNYSKKIFNRYKNSLKGKNRRYSIIKTAKQIIPENYEQIISSYKKIKIPTLIIWGKQDNILPIEQGKALNKEIKTSQFKTIDSCGHVPQEEKPEETYKLIIDFLNSNS